MALTLYEKLKILLKINTTVNEIQKIKGDYMENQIEGKPWYQSKTVWFNSIMALVKLVTELQGTSLGHDPMMENIFISIVIFGNLILRFLTGKPIVSK